MDKISSKNSNSYLYKRWKALVKILAQNIPPLLIGNDLASVFYQQRDWEGEEALFSQVYETKMATLGIGNRSTLATMGNIALVTRYLSNLENAERLNRQALATRENILPPEHLDVLKYLSNLATVLQARNKLEDAESMAETCLRRTLKALDGNHPETFTSMHNLASIYQDRGKYPDALSLYVAARQLKEARPSFGLTHILTLDTISNMGVLFTELGRFSKAQACHTHVHVTRMCLIRRQRTRIP